MPTSFIRVSVRDAHGAADLSLAAQLPVASLVTDIWRHLTVPADPSDELCSLTGRPIDLTRSLLDNGVQDGDTLLVSAVPPGPALVVFDDPVTAVESVLAQHRAHPDLARHLAAAALAGCLGGAGCALIARAGSLSTFSHLVLWMLVGLCTALLAPAIAARFASRPSVGADRAVAIMAGTLGGSALPAAAIAGWLLGSVQLAHAVLGFAVLLVLGLRIRLMTDVISRSVLVAGIGVGMLIALATGAHSGTVVLTVAVVLGAGIGLLIMVWRSPGPVGVRRAGLLIEHLAQLSVFPLALAAYDVHLVVWQRLVGLLS